MDLPGVGRLHPPPASGHPPEASEAARDRAWPGQSTLAQRFLRRAWALQSGESPCRDPSTLSEVTPSTGEPYAGDPPVRFGGGRDRIQSVLPTPIVVTDSSPVPSQARLKLTHPRWAESRPTAGGREGVPPEVG